MILIEKRMIQEQLKTHFETLLNSIERLLNARGHSYERPQAIAQAVMKQSDFYAKNPEKSTPWHEDWCQVAYLAYYLPLNWWRMAAATRRGQQVGFFTGWERFIDFGSGLGSASLAFESLGVEFSKGGLCIEHARPATELHRKLCDEQQSRLNLNWQAASPKASDLDDRTLAVFSYSYTELKELPSWATKCGGVLIVEPATKDDSRRLLKLREHLIGEGWTVAAPCTHQKPCPLLHESERDWCHDRVSWEQPRQLAVLESHMPIKNGTLPYSYMMLRRSNGETQLPGKARMTGDLQEFKGFAKQLICRGPEREFVAWQKRDFKKSEYPERLRGELVFVKEDTDKKGNELRPTAAEDIQSL